MPIQSKYVPVGNLLKNTHTERERNKNNNKNTI